MIAIDGNLGDIWFNLVVKGKEEVDETIDEEFAKSDESLERAEAIGTALDRTSQKGRQAMRLLGRSLADVSSRLAQATASASTFTARLSKTATAAHPGIRPSPAGPVGPARPATNPGSQPPPAPGTPPPQPASGSGGAPLTAALAATAATVAAASTFGPQLSGPRPTLPRPEVQTPTPTLPAPAPTSTLQPQDVSLFTLPVPSTPTPPAGSGGSPAGTAGSGADLRVQQPKHGLPKVTGLNLPRPTPPAAAPSPWPRLPDVTPPTGQPRHLPPPPQPAFVGADQLQLPRPEADRLPPATISVGQRGPTRLKSLPTPNPELPQPDLTPLSVSPPVAPPAPPGRVRVDVPTPEYRLGEQPDHLQFPPVSVGVSPPRVPGGIDVAAPPLRLGKMESPQLPAPTPTLDVSAASTPARPEAAAPTQARPEATASTTTSASAPAPRPHLTTPEGLRLTPEGLTVAPAASPPITPATGPAGPAVRDISPALPTPTLPASTPPVPDVRAAVPPATPGGAPTPPLPASFTVATAGRSTPAATPTFPRVVSPEPAPTAATPTATTPAAPTLPRVVPPWTDPAAPAPTLPTAASPLTVAATPAPTRLPAEPEPAATGALPRATLPGPVPTWARPDADPAKLPTAGGWALPMDRGEPQPTPSAPTSALPRPVPPWSTLGVATPFQFRAKGGPVESGEPYVVGEKGPELFVPKAHGSIVPHDKTRTMREAPIFPGAHADWLPDPGTPGGPVPVARPTLPRVASVWSAAAETGKPGGPIPIAPAEHVPDPLPAAEPPRPPTGTPFKLPDMAALLASGDGLSLENVLGMALDEPEELTKVLGEVAGKIALVRGAGVEMGRALDGAWKKLPEHLAEELTAELDRVHKLLKSGAITDAEGGTLVQGSLTKVAKAHTEEKTRAEGDGIVAATEMASTRGGRRTLERNLNNETGKSRVQRFTDPGAAALYESQKRLSEVFKLGGAPAKMFRADVQQLEQEFKDGSITLEQRNAGLKNAFTEAAKSADLLKNRMGQAQLALAGLGAGLVGIVRSGLGGTSHMEALSLHFQLFSREVASLFIPTFDMMIDTLIRGTEWFRSLSGEQQAALGGTLTLAAGFGLLAKILPTVATALSGVWTLMAANPFLAVAGALAALVASSEEGRQMFGNLFSDLWKTVEPVFATLTGAVRSIAAALQPVLQSLISAVQPLFHAFTDLVQAVVPALVGLIQNVFAPVITAVIENVLVPGFRIVATIIQALVTFLRSAYDALSRDSLDSDGGRELLQRAARGGDNATAGEWRMLRDFGVRSQEDAQQRLDSIDQRRAQREQEDAVLRRGLNPERPQNQRSGTGQGHRSLVDSRTGFEDVRATWKRLQEGAMRTATPNPRQQRQDQLQQQQAEDTKQIRETLGRIMENLPNTVTWDWLRNALRPPQAPITT